MWTLTFHENRPAPMKCLPCCPIHSERGSKLELVIRHLFSSCVGKGQSSLQNNYRDNATIPTAYCFTVETKTIVQNRCLANKKKINILPLKWMLLDESTISIVWSVQSCNWRCQIASIWGFTVSHDFLRVDIILYKFKYKMGIMFQKS